MRNIAVGISRYYDRRRCERVAREIALRLRRVCDGQIDRVAVAVEIERRAEALAVEVERDGEGSFRPFDVDDVSGQVVAERNICRRAQQRAQPVDRSRGRGDR